MRGFKAIVIIPNESIDFNSSIERTHFEIKNIDVVRTICDLLDELLPKENHESYSELISFVTDRPGHDFRYAIDASKIKKDLGWEPKETFESGILKTINWYINNESWWRKIQKRTY